MNKKYLLTILPVIVAIASISIVASTNGSIDAKESVKKHYVAVGMEDFFDAKPGQTLEIPFELVNTNTERESSVNLYVTSQDNEWFKNSLDQKFTSDVTASLDKTSATLAASSLEVEQKESRTLTVDIPEDAEPGEYAFTLIVEKANDSLQVRKYFYVNVG